MIVTNSPSLPGLASSPNDFTEHVYSLVYSPNEGVRVI